MYVLHTTELLKLDVIECKMGLFKTKCQLQLRHPSGVQHRETPLSAMERNEITTEEEIKE